MLVKKYKNKLPLQEVYFDKTERNLVLEKMYRLGEDIFFWIHFFIIPVV